ncbi:polysaccharide biosynthesis/export family protein [Rhizobium sp. BE258]|uniref:polysaccharide biosynthesis/export family protein n=1 Tax=Rhizobium sp. BE258 TaxID=2817722 RepID=UPI00285AA863|nr:polysaccharide biosynthesis/export family protein [Rhizobium sp. BE258]MDR7145329.1 exopolysaccharide production protein ExoF [Rhizobium sp. BE258]
MLQFPDSATGSVTGPTVAAVALRLIVCILSALAVQLAFAANASAEPYRLGIMDKVSIKVVEWQTAEGQFREWPGITGEYIVGPNGDLALPFAGEMKAIGQTTSDIAKEISKNLQDKFGLADAPAASVEIIEFRPLFVAGEVHTPGKYPYDPEMTVLKAVSLAGGMRRGLDEGQRFERDFINARGSYDVLVTERARLMAKKARLTAEGSEQQKVTAPEAIAQVPGADEMVADELAILETNKNAFDLRLKGLDELQTLYSSEVVSLDKKVDNQNRQVDLYKKELEKTAKLVDQGLAVSSRALGLETTLADTQANLLDLDAASLRAKQEMNKAALDTIDLKNERKSKIALDMQETKSKLDENALQMNMYRQLMTEALVNAPNAALVTGVDADKLVNYTIVRTVSGKVQEIPANEATTVQPGDLVKVTIANEKS